MIRQPHSIDVDHVSSSVRTRRGGRADAWVWACVAIALLALRIYPNALPVLEHDSFQYLSAAENALKGNFAYTSLLHFDAERSFGVVPAPMITFPAGFPFAIALVSLMGVSMERAALLICAASTVAAVPLLAWITARLDMSRLLRNGVLAFFVLNGVVIQFGVTALTEAPFALLILLGVCLLTDARLRADNGRFWPWVVAGLVFGIGYFVRYAGLFFIAGLLVLVLRHLLASNRPLAIGHGIAFAAAGSIVMLGVVRNLLLVGNWRGRDEMAVDSSVAYVLGRTSVAFNGLFLGPSSGPSGNSFIFKALFCAFLFVGVVWLTWHYVRHRDVRARGSRPASKGLEIDLLLLVVSYVGCMFYAGMTSSISYGLPRNFVPIVALIVLLSGRALQSLLAGLPSESASRRIPVFALGASFCFYAWLNLLVARTPPDDHAAIVAHRMNATTTDGRSARAAVLDRVRSDQVIVANNGQAVGYVLGRPTVSLVGPAFSEVRWNETAIRDVVRRYEAAAIVISAPIAGQPEMDDLPSPFVRQLAQGNAPPWMRLVFRSPDYLIYEPIRSAD